MNEPETAADPASRYRSQRSAYQAVQAPPGLATRIKARARELPPSKDWVKVWRPVTAGLAVALGLIAVSPLLTNKSHPSPGTPPLPSLTALSRSLPTKPAASMPSFSQLKSVSAPSLPARPKPAAAEPQSRDPGLDTEYLFAYLEEKHDENA